MSDVISREKFESSILIPGFGTCPVSTGHVVTYAVSRCSALSLFVKSLTVKRGELVIAGECDPASLKESIGCLSQEIWQVHKFELQALSAVVIVPKGN